MIDYRTLVYSLDEGITISRLKAGDYPADCDVSVLAKWMTSHAVFAAIE